MPSPFHGIDTMSRALRAFQRQLDVTGHNISNVNTPGYSRQTVDLSQAEPTVFTQGRRISLGNGVDLGSVNRIRDTFLDARRLAASGDLGRFQAMSTGVERIQSTLLEPGENGISAALNKFFDGWSALASNPDQPGVRQQVQLAGQTLADRVRGTHLSLQDLRYEAEGLVQQTLRDIQVQANTIAQLNIEIRQKRAEGAEPNDLMDLRDSALRELASLVDIRTSTFSDGTVAVHLNQFTLVDTEGARTLPTTYDFSAGTLSSGPIDYDVRGGRLHGLFTHLNDIVSYQGRLDTLANNLRTQVNALHQTGMLGGGATGLRFFNDVTPPAAQTGAIDFDLDTAGLAGPPAVAGVKNSVDSIATGTSGRAADGGLALALSRLRDQNIAGLGGRTFQRYYSEFVGDVGRNVQYTNATLRTHGAVVEQIDNQIQSVSGVSLDDEMANMLRFQRSYQAAAKALSTFDQVTGDLIDMLRR